MKFGQDSVNSFGNNTRQDIWNGKFQSNGNILWLNHYGSSSTDEGKGIAVKANGDFFNTGYFGDNAVFGNDTFNVNIGIDNAFIASFNASGKLDWLTQFKGGGDGRDLSIFKDRFIYGTGRYSKNNLIIGKDTLLPKGANDIFITKLKQDGTPVYAFGTGSLRADQANGIAVDGKGNSYITGDYRKTTQFGSFNLSSKGGKDIFITKLFDIRLFQDTIPDTTLCAGQSLQVPFTVEGDFNPGNTF
ncbi:MAG: hypothetical protein BRD49_06080, partial [Bacteroidetes bacterium SW_10_40_5]